MLDTAAIIFGLLGISLAFRYYWELRKWAKQCQGVRIAIARNRQVKLDAPLTDWLSWGNALAKDESSNGRVVFRDNKITVAILRPGTTARVEGDTKVKTVKPNTRTSGGALEVAP